MAKRKIYTDQFRASAVVMLEAAGYPQNPFKLEEVARRLDVPSRTLRRWFNRENNPPPDELVTDIKLTLAELFEAVARTYLTHALDSDVVEETTAGSSATVAAIAFDKLQLMRGNPTERISVEHLDNRSRVERITALLDAGRTRRAGQSARSTDD